MNRREIGGFVNHSVQFAIVAVAIWGAIASGQITGHRAKSARHQCAIRLDAAAASVSPAGTCAKTEKPFTVENGRICDPSSEEAHGQKEPMCATAQEPIAAKHPAPSLAWTIGIVAGLFVALVGGALYLF